MKAANNQSKNQRSVVKEWMTPHLFAASPQIWYTYHEKDHKKARERTDPTPTCLAVSHASKPNEKETEQTGSKLMV
jgi:hypothetical protein